MSDDATSQREYYRNTAETYDEAHVRPGDEHELALSAFVGLISSLPHGSFLDVGAGTGRGMVLLKQAFPNSRVVGVEPVPAMRAQGHAKGLSSEMLIAGDVLALQFSDAEFDWVIETGVLHHVKDFRTAVKEMCRVARYGVMLSDSNNMGQGNSIARFAKRMIKAVGLWPALVFVQTGGKGYKKSSGDGIFYSFCVFDCVDILEAKFPLLHFMNTTSGGPCLPNAASHVMIVARRA
jgi:ubiquinone/menaquinone biosynthesis C-methylase UbiE